MSAKVKPTVLVADNNLHTRMTTTRVLMRDFDMEVSEVTNGMDAIERLSTRAFSFLVLDLDLPMIDGLRVLEILRQGPDDAAMPTVIIAESPDESTVRRLIELGVGDLILRPVDPRVLSQRLATFIQRHRHALGRDEYKDGGKLAKPGATRVLIADGDANFREFVVSTLREKVTTTEAETGVAALKACLESPPDVALIGHDLGLLKSDLLVAELRRVPALRGTRVVAIAPQNHLESVVKSAAYDGVLVRTYIPKLFGDQFDRLLQRADGLNRALALYPALQARLTSAVEQVFGMMLGVDVTPLDASPGKERDGDAISCLVEIEELSEQLVLQFQLTMPLEHARFAAARMLGTSDAVITPTEPDAAVSEIANIITGRLRTALNERGISVRCGLPTIRHHAVRGWAPPADGDAIVVFFEAHAHDLCICTTLSGSNAAGDSSPDTPA
ncbi:MAG: response regulator [Acidobacteria bacterium]|nr:response regulator [Acidobacteriota bacterium]